MRRAIQFIRDKIMSDFSYSKAPEGGYHVADGDGQRLGHIERVSSHEWQANQHGETVGGFQVRGSAAVYLLENFDAAKVEVPVDADSNHKVYAVLKASKKPLNSKTIAAAAGLDLLATKVILSRLFHAGRITRPQAMRYQVK